MSKFLAIISVLLFSGGMLAGSPAIGFAQAQDGKRMSLACSGGCPGSQIHGGSHRGKGGHGLSQPEANHQGEAKGGAPGVAAAPAKQNEGMLPSSGQQFCPILGAKVDRSVFADYDGKRVYFCCPACVSRFKEDPAKVVQQMQSEGIPLEAAPAN